MLWGTLVTVRGYTMGYSRYCEGGMLWDTLVTLLELLKFDTLRALELLCSLYAPNLLNAISLV